MQTKTKNLHSFCPHPIPFFSAELYLGRVRWHPAYRWGQLSHWSKPWTKRLLSFYSLREWGREGIQVGKYWVRLVTAPSWGILICVQDADVSAAGPGGFSPWLPLPLGLVLHWLVHRVRGAGPQMVLFGTSVHSHIPRWCYQLTGVCQLFWFEWAWEWVGVGLRWDQQCG